MRDWVGNGKHHSVFIASVNVRVDSLVNQKVLTPTLPSSSHFLPPPPHTHTTGAPEYKSRVDMNIGLSQYKSRVDMNIGLSQYKSRVDMNIGLSQDEEVHNQQVRSVWSSTYSIIHVHSMNGLS